MVQERRAGCEPIRKMKAHYDKRAFQLWEYRVSHGQVLVRSPKDPTHHTNIDIAFAGVEYMDLPRYLPELQLDDPTPADVARASERLGKQVDEKSVVVLLTGSRRHLVVAAAIKVSHSDMDIFESPFH